jgi:repressor LexA
MEYLGNIYFHPVVDGEKYMATKGHILIPVYGDIPCGPLNFLNDGLDGVLEIPNEMIGDGDYFVLRAKGDSMIGAGISSGDLVIVKKQNYAEEAQIIVAFVEGETTLKRFYKNDKQQLVELRPENENYKTIYSSECVILGVAVKIIKDI